MLTCWLSMEEMLFLQNIRPSILLQHMGLVKRRGNTKAKVTVENFEEL